MFVITCVTFKCFLLLSCVCAHRLREFFDFLPLSNKEQPPIRYTDDSLCVCMYVYACVYVCVPYTYKFSRHINFADATNSAFLRFYF